MSGIHQHLFGGTPIVLILSIPAVVGATDTSVEPASAQGGIRFRSDGQLWISDSVTAGTFASFTSHPYWLQNGTASDYDIWMERLTSPANSGDTLSGSAENTWLNLGTTRDWYFTTSTQDWKYAYVRCKIRDAGTLTVLEDSGTGSDWYISASTEI